MRRLSAPGAQRSPGLGADRPPRLGAGPPAAARTSGRRRPGAALASLPWWLAVAAFATPILFVQLGTRPLELWDEARLANNAIEMMQSGWSLVTTYDGVPDHWNTKPPLMIWLMTGAMHLVGTNEWAVRLPSAIAALLTVALVFAFCGRHLGRPVAGFLAVAILLVTPGYVARHGARSGDYDALLTLWTTAYLLAGYLYVQAGVAARRRWLVACAAGIALAFLTKSVQGLIFVPALLAYVLMHRHARATLREPAPWMAAGAVVLVGAAYYAAREWAEPGHFARTWRNDLLGRFAAGTEGNVGGPLYYVVDRFAFFPWLVPGLAAGAWLARKGSGETRAAAVFLCLAAWFYFLVVSASRTKLPWYTMPLQPLVAILIGLALHDTGRRVAAGLAARLAWCRGWRVELARRILCAAIGVAAVATGLALVKIQDRAVMVQEVHRHDLFLRSLRVEPADAAPLLVLHPGYQSEDGPYYVAPTAFYAKVLAARGRPIIIRPPSHPIPGDMTLALACGRFARQMVAAGLLHRPVVSDGGCAVYRTAGH